MTAGPWLSARGGATLRWGIGADGWARGRSETGALRARGDGLADRWSRVAAAGGNAGSDGASALGKGEGESWAARAVRGKPAGPACWAHAGEGKGRFGLLLGWVLVVGLPFFYFSLTSISNSNKFQFK